MTLKERVETELKKQKRSLSWLALKIDMTVDGLRGSLVTGSIKYANIVRVCEALGINAGVLFGGVQYRSAYSCFGEGAFGIAKQWASDEVPRNSRDDKGR